jgi:hypothetical protein
MVKYNTVVKYGMVQHNAAAILLQYRPTKRNDVFRLRGINIRFITYCTALVSSARTYVWVICSDEGNFLRLIQWTIKVMTLKFMSLFVTNLYGYLVSSLCYNCQHANR